MAYRTTPVCRKDSGTGGSQFRLSQVVADALHCATQLLCREIPEGDRPVESMQPAASPVKRVRCAPVRCRARLVLIALLLVTTGCRSWRPEDREGIFALSNPLSTDGIRGPLERALQRDSNPLQEGEKYSAEGQREVNRAREQFDAGDYATAAKAYRRIAKKYKESSIGEEAQFRLGECYFAMKQYPKAQDAYDQLFEDFPSTRYVEPVSRQMFTIAHTWLDVAEPETRNPVRTVSAETTVEPAPKAPPSRDPTLWMRILPNFHDRSRPTFDTQGRALAALKSIWLNDPTGPLADDALMMTASYHLRKGNHVDADRYFQILREEYSESPHLEDAFVLGSHVKLMSYQGPYYDGTSLTEAQKLKEQTLQLFPDLSERQQLKEELGRMYLANAERAWKRVEYWNKKDNPRAVAVACLQVIRDYPDTRYAEAARRNLAVIDPQVLEGLPADLHRMRDAVPKPVPRQKERSDNEPPQRVKSVSDEGGDGRVRW